LRFIVGIVTRPTNNTELVAIGFDRIGDGTLVAPTDSTVTLTPVGGGDYYQVSIALGGNSVRMIVSALAIKVRREAA
jgi:hypothetical protein